jgi:aminoglycoside 3-N-acetyltransferase I
MDPVQFRKLEADDLDDLQQLRQLYHDVFQQEFPPVDYVYLQTLLASKDIMFFVAQKDNTIIGGTTAYLLPSLYGKYKELYLYDMAIGEPFQRLGIGSRLLEFVKEYCEKQQIKSFFLQADTDNIHAREFYQKNGGIEVDVRHYEFRA